MTMRVLARGCESGCRPGAVAQTSNEAQCAKPVQAFMPLSTRMDLIAQQSLHPKTGTINPGGGRREARGSSHGITEVHGSFWRHGHNQSWMCASPRRMWRL
jgi:hypothetical protein